MVSMPRRSQAWDDFVEAERLYRYYDRLYNRYQRLRHALRLLLFVALSGTVGTALQTAEAWVVSTIAVLVLVLMAVDFLGDYARKAAVAFAISRSCGDLVEEYQNLWNRIENFEVDDAGITSELGRLAKATARTTSRSGDTELVESKRLNKASAAEAYDRMTEKYCAI